jgi:flavin reductase (DIM6/NTAB) family NADH-FMN oxidoreductase RutF
VSGGHGALGTVGVDASLLRAVMGGFATGVTVVTTAMDGERHGMTANSLTSVSLDPPLILVCFARNARTAEAVVTRGAFVVNILDRAQEALSNRFAKRGEDHFAGVEVAETDDGLPLLPGGIGHLVCDVHGVHEAGDHDIVLGLVREADTTSGAFPLLFFRGRYDTVTGRGSQPEELWYW